MIYSEGDRIDDRFLVTGVCSDNGGMGQILFVDDLANMLGKKLALKYCREENEEYRKRFKREVRLLSNFAGNTKVVNVLHSNPEHDPPYFVMPFFSSGDLSNASPSIQQSAHAQETYFNMMIDCIAELHVRGIYHRDIKPQNFLLDGNGLVVSDFGLGIEEDSSSRFTGSSVSWGTHGYLPPEFQRGGFKHHDATGDIFMLGKSFYALITGQNPTFLMDNGVHPVLYHVIERCCDLEKSRRYQSLPELKQALSMAYDVILQRRGQLGEVYQLFSEINDRLTNQGQYNDEQVISFIEKLSFVDHSDKVNICLEIDHSFIILLTEHGLTNHLDTFLKSYSVMVESNQYAWSFSEKIAKDMKKIFSCSSATNHVRARALEIAIDAAFRMNRFSAMDTCREMIAGVDNEDLGLLVVSVIQRNPHSFVTEIEQSRCRCESIRTALNSLQR